MFTRWIRLHIPFVRRVLHSPFQIQQSTRSTSLLNARALSTCRSLAQQQSLTSIEAQDAPSLSSNTVHTPGAAHA
ncbi:hypothetical protein CBOM_05635 [Ceraceosorus bombacis]|uniref:Uncharacterized protein n=1 Tax=Ceraceosorus bombacis TaxID=401625 RepID=A0A0P1BSD5_9BASI|nr:hypothetical protein CBOM_05635 [Ceraceosorus bombacis]